MGLAADSVDGQDVRAVYAKAAPLVERARRGLGPSFLLCHTYRFRGHHVGDVSREYYRARQEEQRWMAERDPLRVLGDWLIAQGSTTSAALDAIQAELAARMDQAVAFAIAAPYPNPDEADEDVYV